MTSSDVDILISTMNQKFAEAKDRHDNIRQDLKEMQGAIPKIAKEKAEEVIAKTSFLKPAEKWGIGISIILVLFTLFSIYGKANYTIIGFEKLQKTIDSKKVIESADWVSENRTRIPDRFKQLEKELDTLKGRLIRYQQHNSNMKIIK